MGVTKDYPLPPKEFADIYSKVPRLTVEVIIQSDEGILLTKRSMEPCAGKWHLPGGTVQYGEKLEDAVKRVAMKEVHLNVDTSTMQQIGIIEYPDHVASGYGDPRGIAFLVTDYSGDIQIDDEAEAYAWFKEVPPDIHANQDEFLIGMIGKQLSSG